MSFITCLSQLRIWLFFLKIPSLFFTLSPLTCWKTYTAFVALMQNPGNGAWRTGLAVKCWLLCVKCCYEQRCVTVSQKCPLIPWALKHQELSPAFLTIFSFYFCPLSSQGMNRRSKSEENLLLDLHASECFQIPKYSPLYSSIVRKIPNN